jgi:hypothetical protein
MDMRSLDHSISYVVSRDSTQVPQSRHRLRRVEIGDIP